MICVTIARERHRHVLAEHHHLAKLGADLVEIRLDYIQTRIDMKRLFHDRPTPIVATYRREQDGGLYKGPEANRIIMLRNAIVEGVDYVDLEEEAATQIPRYGKTKRIISYHNFEETPEDLESIFERLANLDPDVVKICTMANSLEDSWRMLDFVERKSKVLPTVGFCMGDYGIPSRVLCQAFGSPFTYACVDAKSAAAPGQIPFEILKRQYRADLLKRDVQVYGVVADPVGHSLSPLIHNSAFASEQRNDCVYLPFRVPAGQLENFLDGTRRLLNLRGLSVTIPHKVDILPYLTQADTSVQIIGACNTVRIDGDRLLGTNTDYQGAMSSIADVLKDDILRHLDWTEPNDDPETGEPISTPLTGRSALVLGSGGVGKALAFGLARRGAEIFLTDAQFDRAEQLADRLTQAGYTAHAVEWKDRHSTGAQFLLNCTPIGMSPNVSESPFDEAALKASMVVFDAVYNPEETLLLRQAKNCGCATISGQFMFVLQAALQYKYFLNEEPPVDLMRKVVQKALAPDW